MALRIALRTELCKRFVCFYCYGLQVYRLHAASSFVEEMRRRVRPSVLPDSERVRHSGMGDRMLGLRRRHICRQIRAFGVRLVRLLLLQLLRSHQV